MLVLAVGVVALLCWAPAPCDVLRAMRLQCTDPREAAARAYLAGDFRFLAVKAMVQSAPGITNFYGRFSFGDQRYDLPYPDGSLHDKVQGRLLESAFLYAYEYNLKMLHLIESGTNRPNNGPNRIVTPRRRGSTSG